MPRGTPIIGTIQKKRPSAAYSGRIGRAFESWPGNKRNHIGLLPTASVCVYTVVVHSFETLIRYRIYISLLSYDSKLNVNIDLSAIDDIC